MAQAEPDWRDDSLGGRARVALWLKQEVGEGHKFTMLQVRSAIPGKNQIDRRMRDLRPAGWEIRDYRTAPALAPDELLLEKIGLPVWMPEHRGIGLRKVPNRLRAEVFARDRNRCVRCGVAAGEDYPDEPGSSARLTIGHTNPYAHNPRSRMAELVTECARCNETAQTLTAPRPSPEQVWDRLSGLGRAEKRRILSWLVNDGRDFSPEERSYMEVRQLPSAERDAIRERLEDYLA